MFYCFIFFASFFCALQNGQPMQNPPPAPNPGPPPRLQSENGSLGQGPGGARSEQGTQSETKNKKEGETGRQKGMAGRAADGFSAAAQLVSGASLSSTAVQARLECHYSVRAACAVILRSVYGTLSPGTLSVQLYWHPTRHRRTLAVTFRSTTGRSCGRIICWTCDL